MRLRVRICEKTNFFCPKLNYGSPCGVLDQSQWDCKGTPCGLPIKSLRTPWGVLGESLESGRTSVILGLLHKDSLGTP